MMVWMAGATNGMASLRADSSVVCWCYMEAGGLGARQGPSPPLIGTDQHQHAALSKLV